MRRFLQWVGWSAVCVGLIALIAFNMLVVWVATGPRSLKEYIPTIEARINNSQNLINIKIDDIALMWDGWQHPIDARLRQVKILTKKNIQIASFEQVATSADLWALAQGKIRPDSIALHKPVINVYRKMDGTFTLDLGQDLFQGPEQPKTTKPETPIQPISSYLKQADLGELQYLSNVKIVDGILNIGDTRRGTLLTLQNANIEFMHALNNVDVTIAADVGKKDEQGSVYIQSNVPMNSLAAISKITLRDFKPEWIAPLNEELAVLKGMNVPITGWVNTSLNAKGKLTQASLRLNAAKGVIVSDKLDGEFPIDNALIEAKITKNGVLIADNIKLVSGGVNVAAHASVWQNSAGLLGIKLSGKTGAVPVERVKNFWPPWQSPESRDWVISNLSKGKASSATIEVNIQPGQLELPKMPNETVQARINFEKMDVKYKPEHAPVRSASGVVEVNANELHVNISKGDYLTATKVTNAKVVIDDLMADNPLIEVSMNVDAPAADVATVLAYPDLALAEPIGITKDNLKGHAKGKVDIAFSYYAPRDKNGNIIEEELVKYNIDATLDKVTQSDFLNKYDISDATGTLKVDNKKLVFDGNAALFGDTLKANVTHYFQPENNVETALDVDGTISTDTLKKIGVDLTDYIRGNIPSKANIKQAPNGDIALKSTSDLTASEIQLKELNWRKAPATQAKATLELVSDSKVIDISALDFTSGADRVIGAMQIHTGGTLKSFGASTFKLGIADLAVEYTPIEGGHKVVASGAVADLSPWFKKDKTKKEQNSFSDIPALDLTLNIAKATLDENRVVNDLKGSVNCSVLACVSANITGNFEGGKPFAFTIGSNQAKRTIKITTENAGAFLKGLDVYDNMEGGRLELTGTFEDSKTNRPLVGKLFIWDYQLNNTPVLSRIVSLASFGGLVDALQGKGIGFDKLKSDFVLERDVITVKELASAGSSLGISADGTIDTKRNIMDIQGTIVPAYTINSFLKNVPIVGDILTGGEGIIAAVYTVKGNVDEPDVSVNPLSVLAPGFLRKMFE